jgi:peroxiredoxin family protein
VLPSFERTWAHLARSCELAESLERFLPNAHNSRTEKWNIMIQLDSTNAEALCNVKCDACNVAMELFGIERHPTIDHTETCAPAATSCKRRPYLFPQ